MIGNGIYTHIPSSTIPSYSELLRTIQNDGNDWNSDKSIGGRSPYCLSKFSPVPASRFIPMRFCFKGNMGNNLIQIDSFTKQTSYQFSATASLA
jgi:hypothetical protein